MSKSPAVAAPADINHRRITIGREEDDAMAARNAANLNVKAALAQTKRLLADAAGALETIWRGPGSEILYSIPERLVLLSRAADYLQAHAAQEIPAKNFTQAALRAAIAALEGACSALNGKVSARVDAKAARETAERALRGRMSALVEELSQPGERNGGGRLGVNQ